MANRAVCGYSLAMNLESAFLQLSPTTLAECLPRQQIMNALIHPLWAGMPRVAGPAYTVRCGPGDNLMLHAAIYRAPAGSIIVAEAGDHDWALAGGNVCAVAQKNGIAAFVIDGMIRDIAEVRAMRFPVFARGVIPKPGKKEFIGSLETRIACGGVAVSPLDMVVADEEGIVVIPVEERAACLEAARQRAQADAAQSLESWEAAHRQRVLGTLAAKGFD
jgi:4-hydroxy-4-methyl-2-oxoglutarate aldolase